MSDDQRINEARAVFEADMVKTMGKLHNRLTEVELRTGEAIGIGEDDGRIGKELAAIRADMKTNAAEAKRANWAIRTAIALAVGSAGAAATAIWNRGSESGASLTRITTLERDVDRLEQSIRSLWTATAPRTFRAPGDPP